MATVLSLVLAAPLVFAAIRKLSHREDVVRSYAVVGVPEERLNFLAVILLAGAAGLIAGLFWAPIGVAAAIGLVCYFTLAVVAHFRYRDQRNLPAPLALLALAAALLIVRAL
jgi:xanthine/uracil/vitamin C permease (AzgA family)